MTASDPARPGRGPSGASWRAWLAALALALPTAGCPTDDDDDVADDDVSDDDDSTGDDDDATGNQPPAFDDPGPWVVMEGQQTAETLEATDADGDELTLEADGLPAFATFVDEGDGSATLTFAPGYDDEGSHAFSVWADDGTETIEQPLVINVGRVPYVSLYAGTEGGAGFLDGAGNDARFWHPYGMTAHEDVFYVGDGYNHIIRKFDPVTLEVTTVAGVPTEAGYVDSVDGPPQFGYPNGLDVGPDGLIYVADRRNDRIRVVDPATGETTTLHDVLGPHFADEPFEILFDEAGLLYYSTINGCSLHSVDPVTGVHEVVAGDPGNCDLIDGTRAEARIGDARGLLLHGGYLYFSDRIANSIRRVDLLTGDVDSPFGAGVSGEGGFLDGVGTDARFHRPSGLIAVGDWMYMADSDNDSIRRVQLVSGEVETIAGMGSNGNVNGPGDQASFAWPIDVEIGPDGDLYVVDPGCNCIRLIDLDDPDYTVATIAGTVENSGAVDGVGDEVRMSEPQGLSHALDPERAWLLDTYNCLVRSIELDTAEVTTVIGSNQEFTHADGVGDEVRFMAPMAAVEFPDGRLFVVGGASHVIRRVNLNTMVTETVAGTAKVKGHVDGTGVSVRFRHPSDIELGSDGMLYIADAGNRAIRRMDPDTLEVTTLIGPDDPGNPLASPLGLVPDGAGTLYVTDYAACTVLAVDEATGDAEVLAGAGFDCDVVDGVGNGGRLDGPAGIDYDPTDGVLYVASFRGRAVQRVDVATREVVLLSGDPDVMAPVDGPLGQATYSTPTAVLFNGDHLLLLDRYSAHLRKVELP